MSLSETINHRIEGLESALKQDHPEVFEEQKHIDGESPEKTYWHYGYLQALRDVAAQLAN